VLRIRQQQLEVFQAVALGQFEDTMVAHVRAYFPTHFRVLGEDGIRPVIRYGYARAMRHALDTQRSVCLYINAMLLMGSNFDVDPMYPWASEILSDTSGRYPRLRIDRLSDRSLRVFYRIAGQHHMQLNRALVTLHRDAAAIQEAIGGGSIAELPQFARRLFPAKAEVVGDEALEIVARTAVEAAARYGLVADFHVLLYGVLMFMIGSGFDTDPQYGRLRRALTNPLVSEPSAKAAALHTAMHETLSAILAVAHG
jgi:hypothetical protein